MRQTVARHDAAALAVLDDDLLAVVFLLRPRAPQTGPSFIQTAKSLPRY
jgi:hypothetical protein